MLGIHAGAAVGVRLEQELGMSLARTLPELPPPPTLLNHPEKARAANGTGAVAGLSLVLLSPGIALALPSAASLGAGWSRRNKTKDKTTQECDGLGRAALLLLPLSWSRG